MLPSANSKNTLFTYNFQHPAIYKKFFNDISDPNQLVFSSGLFGGCLFTSDITVSVVRDFENHCHSFVTETSVDDDTVEEAEEALETMKETTEKIQNEEEPICGFPKANFKLVDVFSPYLTFLKKSIFQSIGTRAKVITWCKGKPTVKHVQESVAEEALEKVVLHGEYMPFDKSDMIEDNEICDYGFPSRYPHVWSAFEHRLHLGDGDGPDSTSTSEVLTKQVQGVGGYVEKMGDVFDTKTGELAIQFPHGISSFETYRSICLDTLNDNTQVEYEEETPEEVELEGSTSYALANWNNCHVFRDQYLHLESEQYDDVESLDCMSYKSFDFEDDDSNELPKSTHPSEVTEHKSDSAEDSIMYPDTGGFNEIIKEKHDGGNEYPEEGSVEEDTIGHSLEQRSKVMEMSQEYITNDIPNTVEDEIFHDTEDVINFGRAEQLPKVMLKWLGHFWGVEDEQSPPIETISKLQHIFTPLKVAATK